MNRYNMISNYNGSPTEEAMKVYEEARRQGQSFNQDVFEQGRIAGLKEAVETITTLCKKSEEAHIVNCKIRGGEPIPLVIIGRILANAIEAKIGEGK
mgnify:CR=1 FL=1